MDRDLTGELTYSTLFDYGGEVLINGNYVSDPLIWEERIIEKDNLETIRVTSRKVLEDLIFRFNKTGQFIVYLEKNNENEYFINNNSLYGKADIEQESSVTEGFLFEGSELVLQLIRKFLVRGMITSLKEKMTIEKATNKSQFSIYINDVKYEKRDKWADIIKNKDNLECVFCLSNNKLRVEVIDNEKYLIEFSKKMEDDEEDYYYDNGSEDYETEFVPPVRTIQNRHFCTSKEEMLSIVTYFVEHEDVPSNVNFVKIPGIQYIIDDELYERSKLENKLLKMRK